jgi:hypothetical protein
MVKGTKESSSFSSSSSSSSSSISHKSKPGRTSSTLKAFTKTKGKCMFYKLDNSSRGSRSDGRSGPPRGVSTRVWEEKFFPGVSPIPPHFSSQTLPRECQNPLSVTGSVTPGSTQGIHNGFSIATPQHYQPLTQVSTTHAVGSTTCIDFQTFPDL